MANMIDIFGLSPEETGAQEYEQMRQRSLQEAQMSNQQRAAYGMRNSGATLGRMGLGMLGMQSPAMAQAKMREEALSGLDPSNPESILQRAAQIQDPRLKMQLTMLARQQMAEQQKAALEQAKARREDWRMNEEFDWKKEQKKAELEQRAEAARLRSEDARYSADARRDAAAESAALRRELAMMRLQQGQNKPMTPVQIMKLQKEQSESAQAVRGLENAFIDAQNKANALKNHPGLAGASGVRGAFPSLPESEAAKAETLLEEFKAMTKQVGLQLVRQGGSIGQMTEKEWPIVEAMVATINPVKLGKKGTQDQIDKVVAKMEQVFKNAKTQHNEQFSLTEEAPVASPQSKVVDFGSL